MKKIIDDVKRYTPKGIPGYYYLKTQKIYIPYMKITLECLTKKISELNLFFESILKLIEISVKDINVIADILGVSYDIIKEAVIDMVSIDYIYASENSLGITNKGRKALESGERVDIKKTYLKDIMIDAITGIVYDADTVKVSEPGKREVLLESIVKIDSSYLDSHFQEINNLYQSQLKSNSFFGDKAITSELYKIIDISYSELHYVENKVYIYKSETTDELKFEFSSDSNDRYKNEFFNQLKENCRPCQEYFFEKNKNFLRKVESESPTIALELMAQTEAVRKLLFVDSISNDAKITSFTQQRYALYDHEYMSYLYNYRELKYERIFLCSSHLSGLLSHPLCSQLNILAEKIPVFIIYDKNENKVDGTLRYFFEKPNINLFLIPSENIQKSMICFDSKLVMHLQENVVLAFDRPVRYMLAQCDFDKKSVTETAAKLVEEYKLKDYLIKTSALEKRQNKYKKKK